MIFNREINETVYGGCINITQQNDLEMPSDLLHPKHLPKDYRLSDANDIKEYLKYLKSDNVGIISINDIPLDTLTINNVWPIEIINFGSLADWLPYLIDSTDLSMGDMILLNVNKKSLNYLQFAFYSMDDHAKIAIYNVSNLCIDDIINEIENEINKEKYQYINDATWTYPDGYYIKKLMDNRSINFM